jgi:hypothetical protein
MSRSRRAKPPQLGRAASFDVFEALVQPRSELHKTSSEKEEHQKEQKCGNKYGARRIDARKLWEHGTRRMQARAHGPLTATLAPAPPHQWWMCPRRALPQLSRSCYKTLRKLSSLPWTSSSQAQQRNCTMMTHNNPTSLDPGLHVKWRRFLGEQDCYAGHRLSSQQFLPLQLGICAARREARPDGVETWALRPYNIPIFPASGR